LAYMSLMTGKTCEMHGLGGAVVDGVTNTLMCEAGNYGWAPQSARAVARGGVDYPPEREDGA